jgi:hypothetical protein
MDVPGGPPATTGQSTAMIGPDTHSGPVTLPPDLVQDEPKRRSSALLIGGISVTVLAAAAGVIAAIVWRGGQRQQLPTMVVVERGSASSARLAADPGVGPVGTANGSDPEAETGAKDAAKDGSAGEDLSEARVPFPGKPGGNAGGSGTRNDRPGSDGKRQRPSSDGGSKNELRKRINTLRPEVTRCLGKHADTQTTDVEGTVVLHIDRRGHVSSVELQPAALAGTPLAACIRSTFSAQRFPEQRETLEIKVPFSTKLRPAL